MAPVDITRWPGMSRAVEAAFPAGGADAAISRAKADRSRARRTRRRTDGSRPGAGSPTGPGRGRWIAVMSILVVGIVAVGIVAAVSVQPEEGATRADASASAAEGAFPIVAYRGADALGAEELDFGQLLGTGTPVVLNFWAGQCPPCRAEMPDFQRVYDRHADDFLLVGVDIGPFIGLGTRESALALLDELDITYPTAYALDAAAVRDNEVLGMPTTIFYDGSGEVVARHSGLLTEQAFEERVRGLIGATS